MTEHFFRIGNLSKAGKLVDSVLGHLGVREKVIQAQAISNWAQVVGPQIAASTRVERLTDGNLFVSCKSSAWANELSLHKDRIIRGINESVGSVVVNDIRFSAKGFRRSAESKDDTHTRPKGLEAVELTEDEINTARRIASALRSPELARLIEKAVLTGKRLEKSRSMQDGRVDRTDSKDR
ncbi:MAG: DUF721 domain-containing protein [Armatimonadetes bacterium]|nr:DUF721 domain-containing protein [Armatimonadota bacterium]